MHQAIQGLAVVSDDRGGSLHALARWLRANTPIQLRVLVTSADTRFEFPRDIHALSDGGRELRSLLEQVEFVHAVDCDPTQLDIPGTSIAHRIADGDVAVSVQLDGALRPAMSDRVAAHARTQNWPCVATRPSLAARTHCEWLAPFVPWWEGVYQPLLPGTRERESIQRKLTAFLATKVPLERVPVLEDFADNFEDLAPEHATLESVVAHPHRRVLRRQRLAHFTVCAGRDGLSRGALEALLQGVRVLSASSPERLLPYRQLVPNKRLPVHPVAKLKEWLETLDPRLGPDLDAAAWARRVLDPQRWTTWCMQSWTAKIRPSTQRAAG